MYCALKRDHKCFDSELGTALTESSFPGWNRFFLPLCGISSPVTALSNYNVNRPTRHEHADLALFCILVSLSCGPVVL
jgi:hypothetical protein